MAMMTSAFSMGQLFVYSFFRSMARPGINIRRVVFIIAVVIAVYIRSWPAKSETSAGGQLKALQVDLICRDSPLSPLLGGRNLSNAEQLA